MSKTTSAGMRSSKKHSPVCGCMPSDVACTTASKWSFGNCARNSGSAPHALASARTRSGFRPTMESNEPASARANAALRAAPPLPTSKTEDFARRRCRESGLTTASASAFRPRHRPAFRQTVLTAPIRRATGSTASRYRRIFCLCGMVTLKPATGRSAASVMKSFRYSEGTRNGRYTASIRRA